MIEKLPKLLVVDASILFSFFNMHSKRREIIEELPNLGCKLISPEFAFEELADNEEKIRKFGELNDLAFSFLLSLLDMKIESFPQETYKEFIPEANKISPHGVSETKDDPYFALASSLNCPIWSDEKAFKKQPKVKVLSTEEISKLL